MKRTAVVAVVLLAVAVMAEAQQPKKVYRIGYLSANATKTIPIVMLSCALIIGGYPIYEICSLNSSASNQGSSYT